MVPVYQTKSQRVKFSQLIFTESEFPNREGNNSGFIILQTKMYSKARETRNGKRGIVAIYQTRKDWLWTHGQIFDSCFSVNSVPEGNPLMLWQPRTIFACLNKFVFDPIKNRFAETNLLQKKESIPRGITTSLTPFQTFYLHFQEIRFSRTNFVFKRQFWEQENKL